MPRVLLLLLIAMGAPCRAAPPVDMAPVNADLVGGLVLPMDGAMLLFGSQGAVLRSMDGATWATAVSGSSADITRIASNADASVLIAVGARGTVLRSTDGGLHWKAARNKDDADLSSVVYHPPTNHWIACGSRGRVLRSTDAGKKWKPLPTGVSTDFRALFVDPQTSTLLLAGDDGLVGSSRDGGENWNVTRLAMPEPRTPFSSLHRFGKTLLVLGTRGRFLVSTDDAASWDLPQAQTTATWTDAAFDPAHRALVLVGDDGQLLRSLDRAATWQLSALETGGRSRLVAIYYDAPEQALVALGADGVLARSADGGASWSRGLDDIPAEFHGVLRKPGRLVGYGPRGLVATSTDGGIHWEQVTQ